MLDWGIYRCEQRLLKQIESLKPLIGRKFKVKVQDISTKGFIDFNWDSGLIVFNIKIVLPKKESYKVDYMKEMSKQMKFSILLTKTQYIDYFNHTGFNRGGSGIDEEISDFLKIKIDFLYINPKEKSVLKGYKEFNSESMFNSNQILFSE